MIATRYYPRLTDILSLDKLPDQLSFIEDGLENLLKNIYVKDYQIIKSPSGDTTSYHVVLKVYKRLSLEIPEVFTLLLNPAQPGDPDPLSSEIPVSVQFQLEILRYTQNFSLESFSFDPKAFFKLILDILGINERQLIVELVQGMSATNSVNEVITITNIKNDLAGTPDEIPMSSSANQDDQIDDFLSSINALSTGQSIAEIAYILIENLDSEDLTKENIKRVFKRILGADPLERIKRLLTPKISATLQLKPAIEFPRSVLIPIKPNGEIETDEAKKSRLDFNIGPFSFSTEGGIGFDKSLSVSFNPAYPKAQIGNSGLIIGFQNAKLDLSTKTNIPEATADGRPNEFRGVYIQEAIIGFPAFWLKDTTPGNAEIKGRNLLIGTGGISGVISMDHTNGPLLKTNLGSNSGFEISLDSFDITFKQNAILNSNIRGTLKIPGFVDSNNVPYKIAVLVNIGTGGDFSVTASVDVPWEPLRIEGVLDVELKSVSIGRKDGRFYVAVSGAIDFADQSSLGGTIGKFLPDKIDVQKMVIWEDGKFEFEGGKLTLPKAMSLKIGPVDLSITAFGLGSHEQERGGVMRKYRYFTFDGGVNVKPGGVDASGNGIAFYFTVDGGPLHVFFRIQSIKVDIIIPGNASAETAALTLKGILSMRDNPNPPGGTEYIGGVDFTLPKLKMGGSAAMRLNPKVPAFIVDVGLELSTPIVLGSTGLGIYGFRALLGQRYVASKSAANVPEDGRWWEYYKAKIAPDYKEGVQVSKFNQRDGFSLGAGVSLATAPDGGRVFSSKIFFLLSLPEVFLLQGQAQILKQRIGLDATQDPPFFAMLSITNTSIEAALGVNYQIPDEGDKPGSIATVNGVMEMGFFWGNSSAWYINIGRDLPESYRIQVRLLNLFNAYFYLMLSSSGIRAGAGASYKLDKKFGPLRAKLEAYLDVAGRISFRPKQIGGSIQIGGSVHLSIFGFGFGISAAASLAAEAPKPFMISGSLRVCVRVLRKDRCAKFEFNWTFDNSLNESEIRIIKENLSDSVKALTMHTLETLNLYTAETGTLPAPSALDNFMVPMDSYIDIEFAKSVKPSANVITNFGGNTQGSLFMEFFAPQRGKSDRVRHEFELENVEIFFHNGSSWQPYNIYTAAIPTVLNPFVTPVPNPKFGFWQYQEPNRHNKLRIMAQSPINYVSQGSGGVVLEDSGITVESIFCNPDPIPKICIAFDTWRPQSAVPIALEEGRTYFHEKFQFRITGGPGEVMNAPFNGLTRAVRIDTGEAIELYFVEGYVNVTLHIRNCAATATVEYYKRIEIPGRDQPQFGYQLIETRSPAVGNNQMLEIDYFNLTEPVDKVIIRTGSCRPKEPLSCTIDYRMLERVTNLLNQMIRLGHLTERYVPMSEKYYEQYDNYFFNTELYPYNWEPSDVVYSASEDSTGTLMGTFSDSFGYSCGLKLERTTSDPWFSWSDLISIYSLRPDPDHQQNGPNGCFIAEAQVLVGNDIVTTQVKGCTCYPITICKEEPLPGGEPLPASEKMDSLLKDLVATARLVQPLTVLTAAETQTVIDLLGLRIELPPAGNNEPGNEFTLQQTSDSSQTNYYAGELNVPGGKEIYPIELRALNAHQTFRMDAVREIRNLRPDPERTKEGETPYFIADAVTIEKGMERVTTLSGSAPVAVFTYTPEAAKLSLERSEAGREMLFIAPKPLPVADCSNLCSPYLTQQAKDLEVFLNRLVLHKLMFLNPQTAIQLIPVYQQQMAGALLGTSLYPVYNAQTMIVYGVSSSSVTQIEFFITDNNGFTCNMQLVWRIDRPAQGYDIRNTIKLYNLRLNPNADTSIQQYSFLIDADIRVGKTTKTIVLEGTTCYPINVCEKGCNLLLYKVCVQSYQDAAFNTTLPTLSTVQLETQTIINSFSGSIQPLWRPNTRFAIRIRTIDKLFRENGQSQVRPAYDKQFIFGFRTTGPIGHYHKYKNGGSVVERADYAALKLKNREDEFKLTDLKHYMDYDKSYPNADGQLINAKPVYYVDPKLLLFYMKTYVYEMLRSWSAYNGLPETDALFEVQIIDPAADPAQTSNPAVSAGWAISPVPVVSYEVQILNNMITQGTPCVQTTTIDPLMLNSVFTLPELKPLKLYTAVFTLKYRGATSGAAYSVDDTREVLRYCFQTSRYRSFSEQVNSYKLKEVSGTVVKAAVFNVEKAFAGNEIPKAQLIVGNTLPLDDQLHQDFGDRFNRLLEGALKLEAIDPPQTTEFNIIRQSGSNRILGVLVKNPEPFNDPKMISGKAQPNAGAPLPTPDLNALTNTVELSVNGQPVNLCKAIYSKDASQVFITNTNNAMNLATGNYTFTFRSKTFDGQYYQITHTETVTLTVA
jgi:hypothetical protein